MIILKLLKMIRITKLSKDIQRIILLFLCWKMILILISFMAIKFIPLSYQDRFLGGGPINYHLSPQLFSWANFDGEHYLSIAIFGYKGLEQAFFPVYPMLISFFAKPLSEDLLSSLINSTIIGLIISNAVFLLALIILYELIRKDFSKKIALLTISLLLIFPTSFYFGALYNEALFLLLSVNSFISARNGKWMQAGIWGAFASGTRIFGILLFPALLIEAYIQGEKLSKALWTLLIPLGLGIYMLYQYLTVGDALAFYHLQKLVGEQHQSGLTLLPQVYFRYVKMILTVDKGSFIYQTIWLEFLIGIMFFALPIYGYFKKIRLSYLFYAMAGFLLPSIQGSFSSVPRYVLILFPSFIILALWLDRLPKILRIFFFLLIIPLLIIETSLFLRGYWVS